MKKNKMKIFRGQIYFSKIHERVVRVTMLCNRIEVAEIKHHALDLGEVLFSQLSPATGEQVKLY